ncbi:hypothetical protein DFI_18735 (plasmid) [Deinococcus ficus]|uniref:Uncharacterized protein n=2 Tax=Deinococcus ficus TaxID=317577 RepID=A0A221T2W3_9DEIO|nr:hypothetical protein DFI_18735 [Deinococcus ficus]
MTYPGIARLINDRGGSVTRGQLKRAQRDAEPLPAEAEQLLLALQPPGEDLSDLRATLLSAAQDLGLDAQGLIHTIRDAHGAEPTTATQAAVDTLGTLGEQRLGRLLSPEGEAALDERDSIRLLTTVLQEVQAVRTFIAELQRLQHLGWTPTTLTPSLRRRGWTGEAIDQFKPTDLDQVRRLNDVLVQVQEGPDAHPADPAATAPLTLPLTTTAERTHYVESLLDTHGAVHTNDLTAPFGMRGVAVSSFLRNTMKLQGIGNGAYRRRR